MKPRNFVVKDMFTNGLYRAQVVKSKKSYQRKQKHKEHHDVNERFESRNKNYSQSMSY